MASSTESSKMAEATALLDLFSFKFSAAEKMVGKFFVGKVGSEKQSLGLKTSISKTFRGKIKMLSSHDHRCQKIAMSVGSLQCLSKFCRKMQRFASPTF